MDYARNLLEELMNPYEQSAKRSFKDEEVCKDYLVDFCPNDLFINTKADLGPCRKAHDDRLRKEYQELKNKHSYPYEENFVNTLRMLVSDLERKMRRAREKVDASIPEELLNSKKAEAEEKAVIIDEKIKSLEALAESAGEEGRITEAKIYTGQIELLQTEIARLKNSDTEEKNKIMEVCDVCGALLVPGDEQKRLDAHIQGKMHTGYQRIRKALETFSTKADRKPTESSRSRREERPYESSRYGRYSRSYSGRDHSDDRRLSRERSPRRRDSRGSSPERRRSRV